MQEFLAPVVRASTVQTRIAGVRCSLYIEPNDFTGWGVFKPVSHTLARLTRRAKMGERRKYLALFPKVRLVVCQRVQATAWCIPVDPKGSTVRVQGIVPVELCEDVEAFASIIARFDGATIWFGETDERVDPGHAAYLRRSLQSSTEPEQLDRPGLSLAERSAYTLVLRDRQEQALDHATMRAEQRLRRALRHAGAQLQDFADLEHGYRVVYDVDGERHTSLVDKQHLTVQSAGICLSGEDEKFDLASLVGVLREGADGRLVRLSY
jgi:hypothetical protein